jgi:hypothetical protein
MVSQDARRSSRSSKKPTYVNFHLLINSIVHDQAMRQPDSVRLHGMASNVGIVPHIRIIEVGNPLLGTGAIQRRRVNGRERGHGEELGVVTSSEGLKLE